MCMLIAWQDEFEMNMRLIGAPTIKDIKRDMVDASSIHQHIVAVPEDKLYHLNCKCNARCALCGYSYSAQQMRLWCMRV